MQIVLDDLFEGTENRLVPPFALRVALIAVERLSFIFQAHDLYPFLKRLNFIFSGSPRSVTLKVTILLQMEVSSRQAVLHELERCFDFTAEDSKISDTVVGEVHDVIRAKLRVYLANAGV